MEINKFSLSSFCVMWTFLTSFYKSIKKILTNAYDINIMLITKEICFHVEVKLGGKYMKTLKFGKSEMKQVVEEYYRNHEDFEGAFSCQTELGYAWCGPSGYETAVLHMKMVGKMNIGGIEIPMTLDVAEEDVKNAFRTTLADAGCTVGEVSFDMGVSEKTEGYGLGEHTVSSPYFRGVTVSLQEKNLVR